MTFRLKLAAGLSIAAVTIALGGCSHEPASTTSGGGPSTPTAETEAASASADHRACEIAERVNVMSFVSQYVVPGTDKQTSDTPDGGGGESQCDFGWTGRSPFGLVVDDNVPTNLVFYAIKYGHYTEGGDKNAQLVLESAQQSEKKGMDDPINPGFQPVTIGDIGAGVVIGVNHLYVAGTCDYYYEVWLENWKPNTSAIPSFEAMARAIAAADQAM